MQFTVDARQLIDAMKAIEQVGRKAPLAISRTLNHVGNKARTQASRTLAKQTGLAYGRVRKEVQTEPATEQRLAYSIGVSGDPIPLREFAARQGARGVSARPWGLRRVFPSTFIVESVGGNVFKREGKARLPIRKLWGPSLPKELVRDAVPQVWEQTAQEMPARLAHELERLKKK